MKFEGKSKLSPHGIELIHEFEHGTSMEEGDQIATPPYKGT